MRCKIYLIFLFCVSGSLFASFSLTKKQALEFYNAKEYQKSYQIFFHLQEQKSSYEYCFYLGNLSYYLKRSSEAQYWYQKASVYKNLPSNYYNNYAKLLLEQDKKEEALKILELIPNKSLEDLLLCFDLNFYLMQYDKSETIMRLILKRSSISKNLSQSDFEAVYLRYFQLCIKRQNYKKALAISNVLKRLLDTNVLFKKNYVDLLIQTAQFKKAALLLEGELKKASLKSEKLFFYVKLLTVLFEYQKNTNKSLKIVEQALEEFPKAYSLIKMKSLILYRTRQYKKAWDSFKNEKPLSKKDIFYVCELAFKAEKNNYAAKLLEKLYLKNPKSKEILNKLLTVYFRKKDYEKAEYWIAFYRKKYEKNAFLLWKFKIFLAQRRHQKAFKLALELLKSEQIKSSGFYYNLAKLYEKKGDFKPALKYYQKSLKIKPDFTYAHASLGALYTLLENYEQAANHYLILTQILPDYAFYYFQLAQVYALSKQYFLAKEFILAALKKGFKVEFIKNEAIFTPVFKRFPKILENSL